MKFKEWLDRIIDAGLLCGAYQSKTLDAKSKKHLMDIILDSNGASYLCEMQAKGFELPYETILKEFGKYINGKYIAEYKNDKGNGYTSSVYCCYSDNNGIHIHTTSTTILGCKTNVFIKPFDFVQIYADKKSKLEIHCPDTSRVKIDYWDGAIITNGNGNDSGRIDIVKHS